MRQQQQQQIKLEIDTTLVRGSLLSHRMSPHRDGRSLQPLCQAAKKMGRGRDENQTSVPVFLPHTLEGHLRQAGATEGTEARANTSPLCRSLWSLRDTEFDVYLKWFGFSSD